MKQFTLPIPAETAYNPASYFISNANQEAYDWIKSWPQWPTPTLILCGATGAGKTHLSHIWQEGARAIRLEHTQIKDNATLMNGENVGAFVLEQADQCPDESALFHLLNTIREKKKWLLLTSEKPPIAWAYTLPDLRSRLLALPVAQLKEPDDDLIAALLTKQFSDRQLAVAPEVIRYLSRHMERSFSMVTTLVQALDQEAMASHRAITQPLARKLLEDLHLFNS